MVRGRLSRLKSPGRERLEICGVATEGASSAIACRKSISVLGQPVRFVSWKRPRPKGPTDRDDSDLAAINALRQRRVVRRFHRKHWRRRSVRRVRGRAIGSTIGYTYEPRIVITWHVYCSTITETRCTLGSLRVAV